MKKAKHWYDYLWVCAILYFTLGFFNILFAWLGMIDFPAAADLSHLRREQVFLQPPLRPGGSCSASWELTLNAPAASPRPAGCPLSGSATAF